MSIVKKGSYRKPDISLKVQSFKSCNNKHMITSTQTTNTEIFTFIAVLVSKLLTRKVLLTKQKREKKLLKSKLLFKKTAIFTDELLQNYKQLECEIFRKLLKNILNLQHYTFKSVSSLMQTQIFVRTSF